MTRSGELQVKRLHFVGGGRVTTRWSGITGEPQLTVRESEVEGLEWKGKGKRNGVEGNNGREERGVEGLRQRVARRENAQLRKQLEEKEEEKRKRWERCTDVKWVALRELHEMRSKQEHRFAPELEATFRKAAAYLYLPGSEIRRVFLSSYAFSREEISRGNELFSSIVMGLDEVGDGFVDWRQVVAHFRLLEKPKQPLRIKFSHLFRLFEDTNETISLAQLWMIVRIPALQYQRQMVARCLVTRLVEHVALGLSTWHEELDDETLAGFLDGLVNARQDWEGREQKRQEGKASEIALNEVAHGQLSREQKSASRIRLNKQKFQRIVFDGDLFILLEKLVWDRLGKPTQLAILRSKEEEAADAFQRINTKIRWLEAKQWFQANVRPNVLKYRFQKWKQVTAIQIAQKRGRLFFEYKKKREGFFCLGMYAERKVFDRWRAKAADRFARRIVQLWTFRRWVQFHALEKRVFLIQVQKAKRLYENIRLEGCMKRWQRFLKQSRGIKALTAKRDRRTVALSFSEWYNSVKEDIERRRAENAAALERQRAIQKDIEETEAKINEIRKQQEEERERELEMQRRLAEEKAAEEARWEAQRQKAFEATERRKRMTIQEMERREHKQNIVQKQEEAFDETFNDIEAKAVQAAREEAETFLNTKPGLEQLEFDAEQLRNDSNGGQLKMEGTDGGGQMGSEWQKMYDPVLETHFFYNSESGEKVPATSINKEESLNIARANYIAKMVQLAKASVQELRSAQQQEKHMLRIAKMMQAAWRTRKARKQLRQMVYSIFLRRMDPYTGRLYYYNTQTRTSNWTKPILLGDEDMRAPEWVLRCDADGRWYYENLARPWLTGYDRPAGFLPCQICNLQLYVITCETCAEYYCLDCFEDQHKLQSEELATHKTVRKTYQDLAKAQAEQCVMCREATASRLCKECGMQEFFCEDCFDMSHLPDPRRPKKITARMKHRPPILF